MSVEILMPALSPTMEEGTLAKWLKKEGDKVSSGDVIAEIETDKATMEVEAVDEGVLAKILVPEGTEGVKVNAVIAMLAEEGEEAGDVEVPASPPSGPSGHLPPQAGGGKSVAAAETPVPASRSGGGGAPRSGVTEGALSDPSIPEGTTFTETTVRDALRDAMVEEMRRDDTVFVMGEEVAE